MEMSLSNNLRVRIVEAVLAGLSRRRAAARFGVSVTEYRSGQRPSFQDLNQIKRDIASF